MTDKRFYKAAAEDVRSGKIDSALWVKVNAELPVASDIEKQAYYIRLRANELSHANTKTNLLRLAPNAWRNWLCNFGLTNKPNDVSSATDMCLEIVRMLREYGTIPSGALSIRATANSKLMGHIVGMTDYVSRLYGERLDQVAERVFEALFGRSWGEAMDVVADADNDDTFMTAFRNIKNELRNARTADEIYSAIVKLV